MPVQDRFERYAMRVEELSQQEKKWLDVDKVGADLGLTTHDSRLLADLLADEGWVTLIYTDIGGPPKLRMVKRGFDEVAKLRWPTWRRWLDKHPSVKTGVVAAVVSLVTACVAHLLWR